MLNSASQVCYCNKFVQELKELCYFLLMNICISLPLLAQDMEGKWRGGAIMASQFPW